MLCFQRSVMIEGDFFVREILQHSHSMKGFFTKGLAVAP